MHAPSLAGVPPQSPRNYRPSEEKSRSDIVPTMPPPAIPSQTPSAQELRETAKLSISRPEKSESLRNPNGSGAPSPRIRSPSPSSRPGTRNASSESRASGGRSRSDRGNDGDREERRSDRENRQDSRDHAATLGRRDSITHNRSERSGRERTSRDMDKDKDGDREKERDRGRDRHGDREKERDRDRDIDRVRDRERDRDRDRDRDRHRRDDKDRDRDSRKERDPNRGQMGSMPPALQDDRALPTRPDPRHRGSIATEDGLGKRRRAPDDDVSTRIAHLFFR
jgi:THO complex subunit 2